MERENHDDAMIQMLRERYDERRQKLTEMRRRLAAAQAEVVDLERYLSHLESLLIAEGEQIEQAPAAVAPDGGLARIEGESRVPPRRPEFGDVSMAEAAWRLLEGGPLRAAVLVEKIFVIANQPEREAASRSLYSALRKAVVHGQLRRVRTGVYART